MSYPPRYYAENDLHYLTTSVYRRTPVFNSEYFCRCFVGVLTDAGGMKASKCLPLRGIANSTKRESAPAAPLRAFRVVEGGAPASSTRANL
jgi:hypothetical protein